MSFINQLATVNECGAVVINETSGYTYNAFMEDMLNIESMINEAVNTFNRLVNTEAISALLEDGGELSTQLHKDTLLTKLKAAWNRIVELFFKMLDTAWNWIYEQVVLQTKFIEKHKDDIMRTTIVYSKQKANIIDNGKKVGKYNKPVSDFYIKTYSKILNPNFIEPFMSESDLKKYIGDNGRVDTAKLYEYYKNEILGTEISIDIDDINKGKSGLIDGIKSRFNDVKTRKNKIISIRKKYQLPPKELTPEAVKEFQSISMAQVESLKAYNRVTLDYCKASVAILKRFIKDSSKEEN